MESRLIKEFIEYEKVNGASEKTIKAYRIDLEKTFPILFGTVDPSLEQLKSLTIEFIRNKLIEMSKEMAVTTVNRRLASLKSLNNYFSTKYMYVNNIKLVKKLVDTRVHEVKTINNNRYEQLVKMSKEKNSRDAYCITMLLYTGLRASELLGIKWGDIDIERGILTVVGKRQIMRRVRLNELVKETILTYVNELRGIQEVNNDTILLPITYNALRKKVKNYTKKLEIEGLEDGVNPHALRHSFASSLISNGVDINVVSQCLGHSNVRVTSSYYVHTSDDEKLEAINTLL